MEEEQNAGKNVRLTAWIVEGIEIQQEQLRLKMEIARHANPTTLQDTNVAKMKERLIQRFEQLMDSAERLFPNVDFAELSYRQGPWTKKRPKKDGDLIGRPVPLPSQISPTPVASYRDTEVVLRIGEANDALQAIRTEIGYKSYLYRGQIRPFKGKNKRTRGWDNIKRSDEELNFQRQIYTNAVSALRALGASDDILAQYQEITKEDMKTVTAISEPNARGQSKEQLAWFWNLDVSGDSENSQHMEECESGNF